MPGPFALGDGQSPEYSLVRTDQTGRSISLPDRGPERNAVLFTGAPGMGKSVELGRTEAYARANGWPAFRVDASPREPLEERFARAVGEDLPELRKRHGFFAIRKLKKTLRELTSRASGHNTSGELRVGVLPVQGAIRHQRDHLGGEPSASLNQLADSAGELAARKNTPAVLLVDNIDLASDRDLNTLNDLAAHLNRSGRQVYLVAAGGPMATSRLLGSSREVAGVEANAGKLYDIRACEPMTADQLRPALTAPLARYGVPSEPAAIDALVNAANGSPQRLQQLGATAMGLVRPPGGVDRGVAHTAIQQLETRNAVLFEAAWNNSTDAEKDLLARTAQRGQNGLAVSSLTQAAGPDQWTGIDTARQSLKARGVLREDPGSDRVRFADPGMGRWVETHVGRSAAHLGIAVPALQQRPDPGQGARPNTAAARATMPDRTLGR